MNLIILTDPPSSKNRHLAPGASDFSFLFNKWKTMLVALLLVGAAPLTLQAQTDWGNRFIYNTLGTSSSLINAPGVFLDTRFTATEDLSVDQFVVNAGNVVGAPNVIVDVYSDDGGGDPGSLLATTLSGSLIPNVKFEGTLDSSINLLEGSVYHIVTRVSNASVSDSLRVNVGLGSDVRYAPGTGNLDPNFNRLFTLNSGTSWTLANASQASAGISQAVLRNSSTSEAMGQSVGTLLLNASSGAGGTATRGQEFVYNGPASSDVDSVTVRLRKGLGDAAGDLRVVLLDSSNIVLSDDVLFAGGTFSDTSFDLHTVNLAIPVELTVGQTYRLALYSPDSTANSYQSYFPVTLFSTGNEARGATFQGVDGFTISSNTGLTGFSGNTLSDMYFVLGTSPVPEPSAVALVALAVFGLVSRRGRRRSL